MFGTVSPAGKSVVGFAPFMNRRARENRLKGGLSKADSMQLGFTQLMP